MVNIESFIKTTGTYTMFSLIYMTYISFEKIKRL